MSILKARPRKTADDYMKLPEGMLAELIEGEIFMSPSPKARHQRMCENAYVALRRFVEERRLGRVHMAPLDVHLPSGDIVQPDVLFVAGDNLGIIRDWIRGVPDLVIEVLSPEKAERDRIVKMDLYARNGVREYWIVDDAARAVEVYVLAAGRYEPRGYFRETDSVTSAVLAGLSLPAREIFA